MSPHPEEEEEEVEEVEEEEVWREEVWRRRGVEGKEKGIRSFYFLSSVTQGRGELSKSLLLGMQSFVFVKIPLTLLVLAILPPFEEVCQEEM